MACRYRILVTVNPLGQKSSCNRPARINVRNIVCRHCNATVEVPDDLTQAQCVRCGRALTLAETHITASPGSLQTTAIAEWTDKPPHRRISGNAPWDDFRANSPAVQRELMDLATRLPKMQPAEYREPPARAAAKVAERGELLATLHNAGEYRMLHIAIGWCLIIAGTFFMSSILLRTAGLLEDVPNVDDIGVIGLAAAGAGVWYLFFRRPAFSVTFWIFENGILLERDNHFHGRQWDEVHDFQVSMEKGEPLFWISIFEGVRVLISGDQGPGAVPVMRFVEAKITASRFLPALRRIYDGERLNFDRAVLGRAGFWGPAFFTPWSEIARIVVDPMYLIVEKRGKLDWQQLLYRDVSFPLLVVAIARVLIEEDRFLCPDTEDNHA